MRTLADRPRFAMTKRGMSQPKLAKAASTRRQPVSQQSVQQLLSGRNTTSKHIPAIAKALGIRIEWLVSYEEPMDAAPGPARMVPEIDLVRAGHWGDVNDPFPPGDTPTIPASSPVGPRAFALRVDGESMLDLYQHGDIVIVDPDIQPQPGDDVVAKLNSSEEATLKRYRQKTPKEVELVPRNPLYPTLTLSSRAPGRIVGVVVEHHRYRRLVSAIPRRASTIGHGLVIEA